MSFINFLLFVIVFFGLLSIIISASNIRTRIISAFLIPLMFACVYFTYQRIEELKGFATMVLPSTDWIYLGSYIEDDRIYFFAKPFNSSEPMLYIMKFNKEWAKDFDAANKSLCEGKTIVGDGFDEDSSLRMRDKKEKSGDGDETMATPDRPNLYDFEDIQLQRKPSARDR